MTPEINTSHPSRISSSAATGNQTSRTNYRRGTTTTGEYKDSFNRYRSESPMTTTPGSRLSNPNAEWLNLRGTWVTNILLTVALGGLFSCVPIMSREMVWTLTNLTYNIFTFFFFHWLCGTPFDINQGEYGALTLWEQIDEGEQYTPTRKFLMAFPVIMFLLSTHYTRYDLTTFIINFIVLLVQMVAKLPSMHRVRIFGINKKQGLN